MSYFDCSSSMQMPFGIASIPDLSQSLTHLNTRPAFAYLTCRAVNSIPRILLNCSSRSQQIHCSWHANITSSGTQVHILPRMQIPPPPSSTSPDMSKIASSSLQLCSTLYGRCGASVTYTLPNLFAGPINRHWPLSLLSDIPQNVKQL